MVYAFDVSLAGVSRRGRGAGVGVYIQNTAIMIWLRLDFVEKNEVYTNLTTKAFGLVDFLQVSVS